jgi:hypothetical protein
VARGASPARQCGGVVDRRGGDRSGGAFGARAFPGNVAVATIHTHFFPFLARAPRALGARRTRAEHQRTIVLSANAGQRDNALRRRYALYTWVFPSCPNGTFRANGTHTHCQIRENYLQRVGESNVLIPTNATF